VPEIAAGTNPHVVRYEFRRINIVGSVITVTGPEPKTVSVTADDYRARFVNFSDIFKGIVGEKRRNSCFLSV